MKKELKSEELYSTAILLHVTIFAYQKSYENIVGSGSRAILTHAIPYLAEMLKHLGLPELSLSKSLDENISTYISLVKQSGYICDAKLRNDGKNSHIFEVKECQFASCGHKIFKDRHICPFAILAASVIYYHTGAPISIDNSEFSDTGSNTLITVHSKN